MSTKVFDVHGDLNVNTKDAERAINRMAHSTRAFGDSMLQADRISVSLTRRMRSGFDTGMLASIRRNENGLLALGNAFQVAGAGLKKIENESVMTLRAFQRLQRASAVVQTVLGTLAGSIGDLSGAVLSLVGVLSQASFALIGVGGALASVVSGFAVAKIAMNGVGKAVSQLWNGQNQYNRSLRDARKELKDLKFDLEGAVLSEKEAAIELEKARTQLALAQDLPPDNMVRREAELAYQRADLNYRRAKARVDDLQDTIKRGGNAAGRAAAADPFRNLTKSQIAFAKYLASLRPLLRNLKEAAASSFLPPLQTAIETVVSSLFPTLERGFKILGSAMGDASKSFSLAFSDTDNLRLINQFFEDSAPRLRDMGIAADRTFTGILNTLAAAKPLTDQFTTWVTGLSARFDVFSRSDSFKRILELAGYVSTQLAHVFSSFGSGIKNIMDANFPPGGGGAGQVLLDWLNGIANGFEKFTGSETFGAWLKSSTENATTMLSVIGDFLHIFIDLAAQPEVKQFWTTLQGAIPSITKMLMDGLKAGPNFAGLIVSLTKLMAIFSDSEALKIFFDTLKVITDIFVAILTPLKDFLDAIGRVHFWVLAVTGVMSLLTLGGVVLMAFFGQFIKNLGRLGLMFGKLLDFMTRFNTDLAIQKRGIAGWGLALKNALFGAVGSTGKTRVALDNLKESFRRGKTAVTDYLLSIKMLRDVTGGVGNKFAPMFQKIKQGFAAVKATVIDAGRYIRISLTDAMQKFRQVATGALGNAKFAIYTTLVQKGRMIADLYNIRVLPALTKFKNSVVGRFNDARLAILTTLLQKGRMISDLYNTRVVPALKRFQATFSAQNIRMKATGFAIGMMMQIDLIDKRIIPALQRAGGAISTAMNRIATALNPRNLRWKAKSTLHWIGNDIAVAMDRIKLALSPQNIKLRMMAFAAGITMQLDLLDSRIVPAFQRLGTGIANAVRRIGAALSPQNIKMKMVGFTIGMMMQIDLIDKRIIPAFQRMGARIRSAFQTISAGATALSIKIEQKLSTALFGLRVRFDMLRRNIGFNIAVLKRMNQIVVAQVVAGFNRFKQSVMNSTAMIKLQTMATKLATTATNLWKMATSKISSAFSPAKAAVQGFIEKLRQKNSAQNTSKANDIAATKAIDKQTEALNRRNKAAAGGARRSGAGMGLLGAGFAAEGLISGANNGGMSAGSTMTTIGGALMFMPGIGMFAGLALSIAGAITQGFEAAAKAEQERQANFIIEQADITAQRVELMDQQLSKEVADLITGSNLTAAEAAAEVIRRQGIGRAAAETAIQATGITSRKIADPLRERVEAVRLGFVESGVKMTETQTKSMLEVAAKYAASNPAYKAEDIVRSMLAVFTKKGEGGGLPGVQTRFAVDPNTVVENRALTPGALPQTTVTTRGVNDLQTEISKIDKYVRDPQNQIAVFRMQAGTDVRLPQSPKLDTSGLKQFGTDALQAWFKANSGYVTSTFDKAVTTELANAVKGKFMAPVVSGVVKDTGYNFFADPFSNTYEQKGGIGITKGKQSDFRSLYPTSSVTGSGLSFQNMFSTASLNKLLGTDQKPVITSIKKADLDVLKQDPNAETRTTKLLSKLAGAVDSSGNYLNIVDASAKDKTAPQIYIPATGLTKNERTERENINAWLREAWKQ